MLKYLVPLNNTVPNTNVKKMDEKIKIKTNKNKKTKTNEKNNEKENETNKPEVETKPDEIGHSNYLATKYAHSRDAFIQFFEVGHRYVITIDPEDTTKYTSVTTWNHSHFPKFDSDKIIQQMMNGKKWNSSHKYWGLTADQIKDQWAANGKEVSEAGTKMHFDIECFMNTHLKTDYADEYISHLDLWHHYQSLPDAEKPNTSPEWCFFLQFVNDLPNLKPFRTEWTIFDETLKIAGSIDMVYQNPEDGTLSIYDWKRCKDINPENMWNKYSTNEILSHIPDTNFWHYTLQLNTYKKILERKYGYQVRELFLVRLHPDNPDQTYELIELPILAREMEALFSQRWEEMNE